MLNSYKLKNIKKILSFYVKKRHICTFWNLNMATMAAIKNGQVAGKLNNWKLIRLAFLTALIYYVYKYID